MHLLVCRDDRDDRDGAFGSGLNDLDIRKKLRRQLAARGRVVEEWNVGASRVDVALISPGLLHGFEIKSDVDSLSRLARQALDYGALCDLCTLVAVPRHCRAAEGMLPSWWGIMSAESDGGLHYARRPAINPDPSHVALAWQLWCGELRGVLRQRGVERPPRTKAKLVAAVSEAVPYSEFRKIALLVLLNRGPAWKGGKEGGSN